MEETKTIGQLARDAGLPTSTVRYYERVGLIRPSGRTMGNYRIYRTRALDRLRFIQAAQSTGFTLSDIKALLKFQDGETAPCEDVRILIEDRLKITEERLRELRHVKKVLKSSLEICQASEEDEQCQVIEKLRVPTKKPPAA